MQEEKKNLIIQPDGRCLLSAVGSASVSYNQIEFPLTSDTMNSFHRKPLSDWPRIGFYF